MCSNSSIRCLYRLSASCFSCLLSSLVISISFRSHTRPCTMFHGQYVGISLSAKGQGGLANLFIMIIKLLPHFLHLLSVILLESVHQLHSIMRSGEFHLRFLCLIFTSPLRLDAVTSECFLFKPLRKLLLFIDSVRLLAELFTKRANYSHPKHIATEEKKQMHPWLIPTCI